MMRKAWSTCGKTWTAMFGRWWLAPAFAAALLAAPAQAQLNPMLPPDGGPVKSYVDADNSMQYGPFADLNPDCSLRANPTLRILRKPRKGRVVVSNREGNIRVPESHPYRHCNLRRIVAVTVLYIPNPGFRGEDRLSFSFRGLSGDVRRLDFVIYVR